MLEKLKILHERFNEISVMLTQPDIISDQARYIKISKEYKELKYVIDKKNVYEEVLSNISEAKDIWVIGGAKLIEGLLDSISEFHLSQITGVYNCDTFLPKELIKESYFLTRSNKFDGLSIDIWCKK